MTVINVKCIFYEGSAVDTLEFIDRRSRSSMIPNDRTVSSNNVANKRLQIVKWVKILQVFSRKQNVYDLHGAFIDVYSRWVEIKIE